MSIKLSEEEVITRCIEKHGWCCYEYAAVVAQGTKIESGIKNGTKH